MIDIDSKKVSSITLIALFILSIFAIYPVIKVAPAKANPTYMTVSSDYLGNDNIIRVDIVDAAISGKPNITVAQGSVLYGPITLSETVFTGHYAIFLTMNKSGWAPSTIKYLGKDISVVQINGTGHVFTIAPTASPITITYVERSESQDINAYDTQISVEGVDRTTVPPDGVVYVTASDPTANWLPNATDIYGLTSKANGQYANWSIYLNGVFGKAGEFGSSNATETGANTGEFLLSFDLAALGINVKNGDVLQITLNDTEGGSSSTDYLQVKAEDATFEVSSSYVTYTQPVTITLKDFDLNKDTKSVESITLKLNNSDSMPITLTETGYNTGEFTAVVYVKLGATESNAATADGRVFYVPPGTPLALNLTYTDINYIYKQTHVIAFSLKNLAASVSFESSQYGLTGTATVDLTLPNVNDDPTAREPINVTVYSADNTTAQLFDIASHASVGNINLYEYNATTGKYDIKLPVNDSIGNGTLLETDISSGKFVLTVSLTALHFTSAAKLNITLTDPFTGVAYSSVTSIGGKVLGTLSLDRSEYPVAPNKNVLVYITVNDSDLNMNPLVKETTNVYVHLIQYNGTELSTSPSVTLTETGVDTGVFMGVYQFNISDFSKYLINGWIQVNYSEPLASSGWVIAKASLVPHTGSLSVNTTTCNLGDGIAITLNEPDLNLDSENYDTVTVSVVSGSTTTSVVLNETGPNTGVFTNTSVVGESPLNFAAGASFYVTYTDPATADSSYIRGFVSQALKSSTVEILSHTADVVVGKLSYGPYDTVYVNVSDPDLLYTAPSSVTIKITSSMIPSPGEPITAYDKVGYTFMFKFKLQLNTNVAAVDTVYIYYTDNVDAEGNPLVLTKSVSVSTVTGSVSLDKSTYKIGEYATITVTDLDRNTESTSREFIWVIAKSTSYPQGVNVTLLETGVDTGVFSARLYLSSELPTSNYEIYVKTGDTLTIEYTDPLNASGEKEVVTALAHIGVPAPTYPVPAKEPSTLSSGFQPITNVTVSTQIFINATFTNNYTTSQYVVAFVQVLDSEGHPVFFTYHIVPSLAAGQTMSVLDAWTPSQPGTYTIRVLITDKLVGGKALSEPVETTITVTE